MLDERAVTVLFVEDDEMLLKLLHRISAELSCTPLFAADTEGALALCADVGVDVIMSDFSMPGGSGLALLTTVAARWPATLRVLVTGYPRAFFDDDALQVVDHMVLKPWRTGELRAVIAAMIEQAHARTVR